MAGSNTGGKVLQFPLAVRTNKLFIEAKEIRIHRAAMSIVAGKTGGPQLAAAAISFNMQGVVGKTLVGQDAGPAVAFITERVGKFALAASIVHLVVVTQQPAEV